ncbi:MAG: O-antigen ligase family protein [Lachnospiraceae bacterium]|nr:O-antigen ligase family protein [Lachnospiraceae bacterium]
MKHNLYPITSGFVFLYVTVMFLVYPLYYQNYYYDIVTCRFYLFVIMTGITVLLCLTAYFVEGGGKDSAEKKEIIWGADWIVLVLWGINLISVLLSDHMQTAIVGTPGRSSGLITITCYVAVYFMITRFYTPSVWTFRLLCISSIVASVIGSLHFLDIDFLGFYDGLGTGEKAMYLSTMGHANVVASFYGLVLPVVMVFYVNAEAWGDRIFYGSTLVISAAGLFATGCESGAIIAGAMFLAGFVAIRDNRKIYRIFMISLPVLAVCKILLLINEEKQMPRSLETFQKILGDKTIFIVLVLFLLILSALSFWQCRNSSRQRENGICIQKSYIRGILITAILFILIFVGVIIFFSTVGKNIPLGRLENMLRFNEKFGSYRGYIWKLVVSEYGRLPLINKLFGVGCDTLQPFLMEFYSNEMYVTTGAYYDNAHNEFLQYLITTGILGLFCYIIILFIKLRQGIRYMIRENSVIMAAAVFGVLGYLLQSLVDINQCVTTPLFVLMVSMLGCRGPENGRTFNLTG